MTENRLAPGSAPGMLESMGTRCAIVAALAAAGCQAGGRADSASAPLIGGTVVSGGDPAVVALLSDETVCCTGTLISPTVVITAAHCLEANVCGPAEDLIAYFGDDATGPGARLGVSAARVHPDWNGDIDDGHDLALLQLEFSMDPALAVPLGTTAAEELIGQPYRISGFGVMDRNTGEIDGKKRTGTVAIADAIDDVIVIDDPGTVVCFGDSGGPGFVTSGGVEQLAGVHSWTWGNCVDPNGDTRVDLYAAGFIEPWVQANDPVCGADGTCARTGCVDDPDCQPCGPDGTCASDCPLPDVDCPTGELGEICQADSQCASGTCVIWYADPSTRFCSRPCDPAADLCPAPMRCQSVDPFGNVCYFGEGDEPPGVIGSPCTEPSECGAYLCVENECVTRCDPAIGQLCPASFECRGGYCRSGPGDSRGCCSGSDSGSAFPILVLMLLTWSTSARRARRR